MMLCVCWLDWLCLEWRLGQKVVSKLLAGSEVVLINFVVSE